MPMRSAFVLGGFPAGRSAEDETGIALVERRGRGVALTGAGRLLVEHAYRLFAIVEEARTNIAALKNTVAGDLRIAAQPSSA
ncbi:hypothetical protein QWJ46_12800 [Rhizobium sp. CBN3]|nr:hypothetical protein [Rhizobium sp. CBN3]MDO3433566.1 hypothetical protein [Rhizobium sp. CBN3]